jgi:glucose-6-phosphate isomerase
MRTTAWLDALAPEAARVLDLSLAEIAAAEPARGSEMSLRVGPLFASYARQRFDRAAWQALQQIADEAALDRAMRALVDGEEVNFTERRPALHTALRGDVGRSAAAQAARRQVLETAQQMDALAARLGDSPVTDIVNVGIGGSDLGPRLALDALAHVQTGRFRVHFLSNVDGHAAQALLRRLDPARSAAVLVSKSFSTQETLLNGSILRDWLGDPSRLYAVSANVERAGAFGVAADQVLPIWDWVGGRYSMWSAVGFAVRLALGGDGFAQLLAGAALLDRHAVEAPPARNLAVWQALTAVWNRNALGYDSHAILPYDERLRLLPAYLQQLTMESLGKSVRSDGSPVVAATVPVLWGGAGTDCQHSFFQALHQGSDTLPADLIGVIRPDHGHRANHDALLANLLAQSEALANGAASDDPHRAYPGSRAHTVMLLDALTPASLGALLALHEHSVYLQSVLWDINAFDQWGVELGKKIAGELLPAVVGQAGAAAADPLTAALLGEITRGSAAAAPHAEGVEAGAPL